MYIFWTLWGLLLVRRLLHLLRLPTTVVMAAAVWAKARRTSVRRRERVLRGAFKFGVFNLHDSPPIFIFIFWRTGELLTLSFLWLQREVPETYLCGQCDVWEYV